MNPLQSAFSKLKLTLLVLKNKGASIIFLVVLMFLFVAIPDESNLPFVDLLYAMIRVSLVFAVAPIFRLLVFPYAASYAARGKLEEDLELDSAEDVTTTTVVASAERLRHYRLATLISYAVATLCVYSLA
jgi:hypothetical protein